MLQLRGGPANLLGDDEALQGLRDRLEFGARRWLHQGRHRPAGSRYQREGFGSIDQHHLAKLFAPSSSSADHYNDREVLTNNNNYIYTLIKKFCRIQWPLK